VATGFVQVAHLAAENRDTGVKVRSDLRISCARYGSPDIRKHRQDGIMRMTVNQASEQLELSPRDSIAVRRIVGDAYRDL
jgi:hypothetical protein